MSTTYHLRNNDGTEVFTGTISPAPGGGSMPGAARVLGPFSFTFADSAALANGIPVYVPTVNEILLNAWIEITTAFDGTAPYADLGQISAGQWIDATGWFANGNGQIALSNVWGASLAAGIFSPQFATTNGPDLIGGAISQNVGNELLVPARFVTVDPVMLCAGQAAATPNGGTPIDSLAGEANVYLLVSTPAPLP